MLLRDGDAYDESHPSACRIDHRRHHDGLLFLHVFWQLRLGNKDHWREAFRGGFAAMAETLPGIQARSSEYTIDSEHSGWWPGRRGQHVGALHRASQSEQAG